MKDKLTRRARQALETKRRLYENALALFREKDLEDVTIAEICDAANISSGHFYNYFDSKEALLLASYPAFDDFARDEFSRRAFADNLSAIQSIVAEQTAVAVNLGPGLTSQIMKLQLRLHGKYVIESNRFYHAYMKKLVRDAVESGELHPDTDAGEAADMILRLVRGVFFDWGVRGGEYDLEEKTRADLQVLLKGLIAK
ncbi:MAG: TetR/AcrR family transcriptional regulator [Syntrophomonadaceae bacterium]|jgi:AcrR family transcriptional regulator|nr:TetR/AcrR family transcriptional regulator [Syntrophomonadaceae bacterium]